MSLRSLLSRSHLRDALLVAALIFFHLSVPLFLSGMALFLLGLALRLWAKGILRRNEELTEEGPYALCRNPFYLGNLLLDASICLLAGRPLLLLLYLPLFALAYLPTIRREEDFLLRRFGPAYARFRAARPMLLPRIPRALAELRGRWSFSVLLEEREVSRTLRLLALPFLLLWCGELHEGLWELAELEAMALLSAAAALHLAGRLVYQGWERKRQPLGRLDRAVTGLVCALLVACLVVDFCLSERAELREQARRFGATEIASVTDLNRARTYHPGRLLIISDDVMEDAGAGDMRHFTVVKTIWSDFEVFYLLRAKMAIPSPRLLPSSPLLMAPDRIKHS